MAAGASCRADRDRPTNVISITLPSSQTWFGHEPRLRLDPPSPLPVRDDKLAQLVARGFAARDQLLAMTKDERSAMPLTAFRHLERMARMAYLAPDIIRAILNGTRPKDLSGRALWRTASMPMVWADQRKVLGFPTT